MDAKSEVADAVCQAFFMKLMSEKFYGTVETIFEDGRIVRIKKHETLLEGDVKKLIEA
jgi:hypothetical protein